MLLFSILFFSKAVHADTINYQPVYRLYQPSLKYHLYTQDKNEYQVLSSRGWNQEGVAWTTSTKTGEPVYRLYNTDSMVHLYTQDKNEYQVLSSRGWKQEGVAFRSSGNTPVYRLYNTGLKKHLYTQDKNEYQVLSSRGWKQEGVAFKSDISKESNSLPDKIYVMKRSGKASSFVIVESNGRFGLIDAGTSNFDKDYQNDLNFISSLGIKKFDFVFLTHLDGDHTNYIDSNVPDLAGVKNPWIFNNYVIGKVILKDQTNSYASNVKNTYLNLTKVLRSKGIPYEFQENFQLGDFNFRVFNQEDASQNELEVYKTQIQSGKPFNIDQNLESLGLVVEKNGYKTYFGGDQILWDEAETAKKVGDVDVVVVPHHGNIDGVSQIGAQAIKPEVSIVSNSYVNNNRLFNYQSVHEPVRKTVNISERTNQYYGQEIGADIYWTGDTGTVTVDFSNTSNGIVVSASQIRVQNQLVHDTE